MKLVHSTETPYSCVRCGERFKLRRQYKKHLDRIRKCAPVLIGIQGKDSSGQQVNDSIGGHKASDSIGQPNNNSKNHLTNDLIGQQANNSIGQQTNNPIGHNANNSIGGEENVLVERPKIHPCSKCSKTFTSRQGLRHHMLGIHLGVRKYKCSHCDAGFVTLNNLRDHERLHSDVKSFECEICGKLLKQRAAYYAHRHSCRKKQGMTSENKT